MSVHPTSSQPPGIPCLCCFATTPPSGVKAKAKAKIATSNALLRLASNPNTFEVSLGGALSPKYCCVCFFSGICPHCSACYYRQRALAETPDMNGRSPVGGWPYRCCQGYIPKICCCDFPNMCVGNSSCIYVEGCCCPFLNVLPPSYPTFLARTLSCFF